MRGTHYVSKVRVVAKENTINRHGDINEVAAGHYYSTVTPVLLIKQQKQYSATTATVPTPILVAG